MSIVTPTKRRNGNKPSPAQNEKKRVRNSSVTIVLTDEERGKREKSLANASRTMNGAFLGLSACESEEQSGFRTLCKRIEKAEDVLSADELTLSKSQTAISVTNGEFRKLRKLISGAYGSSGKERQKARAKLLAYVQKLNGPKKVSTRK